MSVDYDQFIREESRAVILTGLPPRFPQNEIMSWFSEYSLKPQQLQTVPNPSSEASTEAYQAIFQTHSEARRALDLNMSLYGDHVIEVSPSIQPPAGAVVVTAKVPSPPSTVASIEINTKPSVVASPEYQSGSKQGHSNGQTPTQPPTHGSGHSHSHDHSQGHSHDHSQGHSQGHSSSQGRSHSSYPERNTSSHNSTDPHDLGYAYLNSSYSSHSRPSEHNYPNYYSSSSYSSRDPYGSSDRHPVSMRPPITKVVPGDWVCPVQTCATYNYAFRINCYKCDCVKPPSSSTSSQYDSGSAGPHRSSYRSKHPASYHSPYPPPSRSSGHGSRPGDWNCPNSGCGFQNFASRVACLRCSTENPVYRAAPHAVPNPVPLSSTGFRQGDWICPGCSSHNFASRYACMRCSGPRPESAHAPPPSATTGPQPLLAGDWICRHNDCGFHNFAKRHVCGRCGAPSSH